MSTKAKVLKILEKNMGKAISGQEIADQIGLSRNSVWKAIKSLQKESCPIISCANSGYKLTKTFESLSEHGIGGKLNEPCQVEVLAKVDSTNNYAKNHFDGENPLLVIANEQTGGRGRLGRTFYSPAGTGIYFSYAFKPNFGFDKSLILTGGTAVAIATAMEDLYKISPKIKWVNDLYYNDKKIGGILTEAITNIESGQIDSIVIGIGLNCTTTNFPKFETNEPGSLFKKNKKYDRTEFIAEIINNLTKTINEMDNEKIVFEFKRRCNTLGKQITIYHDFNNPNEIGERAKVYDIDSNCGLIVEFLDGPNKQTLSTITSGEISVR